MDIQIRSCDKNDFERIFELLGQLWPDTRLSHNHLKEVFLSMLDAEDHDYIVAEHAHSIIGFCSLSVMVTLWSEGKLGHIDELIVDEGFRGKGVGSRLLEEITRRAEKKGCKKIELESDLHRKDAHRFYLDRGYIKASYSFWKKINV